MKKYTLTSAPSGLVKMIQTRMKKVGHLQIYFQAALMSHYFFLPLYMYAQS